MAITCRYGDILYNFSKFWFLSYHCNNEKNDLFPSVICTWCVNMLIVKATPMNSDKISTNLKRHHRHSHFNCEFLLIAFPYFFLSQRRRRFDDFVALTDSLSMQSLYYYCNKENPQSARAKVEIEIIKILNGLNNWNLFSSPLPTCLVSASRKWQPLIVLIPADYSFPIFIHLLLCSRPPSGKPCRLSFQVVLKPTVIKA